MVRIIATTTQKLQQTQTDTPEPMSPAPFAPRPGTARGAERPTWQIRTQGAPVSSDGPPPPVPTVDELSPA